MPNDLNLPPYHCRSAVVTIRKLLSSNYNTYKPNLQLDDLGYQHR